MRNPKIRKNPELAGNMTSAARFLMKGTLHTDPN
jgi:hypothetical protein